MTDPREPVRLSARESGAPDTLRRLLANAHADVLDRRALNRVADRAEAALGGASAIAQGPTRLVWALRLGTALAIASGVAGAALLDRPSARDAATDSKAIDSPIGNAKDEARAAAPAKAYEGADALRVVSSGPPASAAKMSPARGASASRPTRKLDIASTGPVSSAETNAIAGSSDGIEELALLRRARAALATDPAQALLLAEEHEKRFPHGLLAEEREVIWIEALANSGANDEANARLDRFHRAFPQSVHQPRMGGEKVPR